MKHLDFESLLLGLIIMMLALLATVAMILSAHAASCLSIDVPPQAVLGNYDGDTFQVFSMQPGGVVKIRVEGVDTPELSKQKNQPDEPGAQEAKAFTKQWLAQGMFQLSTCGKTTLDRIVAKVSRGGRSLAQDLLDAGLTKNP